MLHIVGQWNFAHIKKTAKITIVVKRIYVPSFGSMLIFYVAKNPLNYI